MGRPVKSTKIGSASGRIQVTAAFSAETTQSDGTGSEAVSTAAGQYIISQRSTKRYKVSFTSADGSSNRQEVLTLTPKASGSLTNGEFSIKVVLDDSTVGYVSKLHNNTVKYSTDGGTTFASAQLAQLAEGTDEGQVSGQANIDVLS